MALSKKQTIISIVLNMLVAVFSAIGTVIAFQKHGFTLFQFYTVDSNVFAMLACTLYSVFLIRKLRCKKEIPLWAVMSKYAAVCCLSVTFIVVVAVLSPMFGIEGYRVMLFTDDMLFHHLLTPLIAALSFFLFDRIPLSAGKAARFALIPTAIYAVIVIALNILKKLEGPYPFLMVYNQPVYMSAIWVVVILGGAYAFAWLIAKLRHTVD